MKLIIQIPCYNEEKTLPVTLGSLPRKMSGIDEIEWLVIDDGSTDNTVAVAREHGADYIISNPKNRGLAQAFSVGLQACIERGADIIVNTDADNQYCAECIPALIDPILQKRAEIVIGARPIDKITDFTATKKLLQKFGSWVVRQVSGTDIPDAPSGFRAFTRNAAKHLNVFSKDTYTLETIIQAGQKNIPIIWVPVETNPKLRSSRLIKSIKAYILRSTITIVKIFVVYKPFKFFFTIGAVLAGAGCLIGIRFLFFYFIGEGQGKIQSLILASILLGIGFQTIMVAFVAELLGTNRSLLEEIQYRLRQSNSEHIEYFYARDITNHKKEDKSDFTRNGRSAE